MKKVTIEPSEHRITVFETTFGNCENLTELNIPDNINIDSSVIIKNNGGEPTPTPALQLPDSLKPSMAAKPTPTPSPKTTPRPTSSPTPEPQEHIL